MIEPSNEEQALWPDVTRDYIHDLEAEIERLREACVNYDLALLLAFPNGASDEVFVHWNDARAALGETE